MAKQIPSTPASAGRTPGAGKAAPARGILPATGSLDSIAKMAGITNMGREMPVAAKTPSEQPIARLGAKPKPPARGKQPMLNNMMTKPASGGI